MKSLNEIMLPGSAAVFTLASAMVLGFSTSLQAAGESVSILHDVRVKGQLRPRYERVDEDNNKSIANAMTNRLVIGIETGLFGTDWLSGFAEMTDVHSANNNYNSTNNGQTNHQVVADPGQTRLTQSYLDVKFGNTLFRAGRQMVNLDNQRFVGAVNWRQMPQTFNAYALVDNSFDDLNITLAYVTQVNTIKAADADSFQTRSALLNVKYDGLKAMNVTGYSYLLGSIHDTMGVAVNGSLSAGDGIKLNYRVEYASQRDASLETASQGKPGADADYINLQAGMNLRGFLAGLRYEVLSGSNGNDGKTAFSTPLATLHGQNGWADRFLKTPQAGLVDMNIMLGYKAEGLGVAKVIYHDFSSDAGSINYGSEIDLLYKNAIPGVKNLNGLVKAAFYRGGDSVSAGNEASLATDKTVFWVMMDYRFQ